MDCTLLDVTAESTVVIAEQLEEIMIASSLLTEIHHSRIDAKKKDGTEAEGLRLVPAWSRRR